MNTDRTAALPRSTALAERSSAASGRTSAPPSDAFAVLLGAADQQRTEQAPRRDDGRSRRDDGPRPEQPRRGDHSRREAAARPDRARPADAKRPDAQPAAQDAPAAPVAEAPAAVLAPVTPAVVAPEIFALQLAGPLPPAVPVPADAPALPGLSVPPLAVVTATSAEVAVPAAGETATPVADPLAAEPEAPVPAPPAAAVPVGLVTDPAAAAAVELPVDATLPQAPDATPAPTDTPPAPGDTAAPSTGEQQTPTDGQAPEQAPATPAPAPVATAFKPADAPAAVASTIQPIAAAGPVAAPLPTPPGVERTVPLSRVVQTTATMLHVAHERGITHARLNLKPVELGGIEVRLQTSPLGVTAQLVADSPEAARMLSQASDDLRRQLEAHDVTLLSLDVSTSGDQRQQASAGGPDGYGQHHRPGGSPAGADGSGDADAPPVLAETTIVLPDGVLVDVLA